MKFFNNYNKTKIKSITIILQYYNLHSVQQSLGNYLFYGGHKPLHSYNNVEQHEDVAIN